MITSVDQLLQTALPILLDCVDCSNSYVRVDLEKKEIQLYGFGEVRSKYFRDSPPNAYDFESKIPTGLVTKPICKYDLPTGWEDQFIESLQALGFNVSDNYILFYSNSMVGIIA